MGLWDSIKNIMAIPDEDDFEEEVVEKADRAPKSAQEENYFTSKKTESAPKIIKSKTINYSQNQSA